MQAIGTCYGEVVDRIVRETVEMVEFGLADVVCNGDDCVFSCYPEGMEYLALARDGKRRDLWIKLLENPTLLQLLTQAELLDTEVVKDLTVRVDDGKSELLLGHGTDKLMDVAQDCLSYRLVGCACGDVSADGFCYVPALLFPADVRLLGPDPIYDDVHAFLNLDKLVETPACEVPNRDGDGTRLHMGSGELRSVRWFLDRGTKRVGAGKTWARGDSKGSGSDDSETVETEFVPGREGLCRFFDCKNCVEKPHYTSYSSGECCDDHKVRRGGHAGDFSVKLNVSMLDTELHDRVPCRMPKGLQAEVLVKTGEFVLPGPCSLSVPTDVAFHFAGAQVQKSNWGHVLTNGTALKVRFYDLPDEGLWMPFRRYDDVGLTRVWHRLGVRGSSPYAHFAMELGIHLHVYRGSSVAKLQPQDVAYTKMRMGDYGAERVYKNLEPDRTYRAAKRAHAVRFVGYGTLFSTIGLMDSAAMVGELKQSVVFSTPGTLTCYNDYDEQAVCSEYDSDDDLFIPAY